MAETMVFPALLKFWRGVRGMSQLDLSLAADVSARHLSFLETGRSSPSQEMVLRLGATLGISMREQNELLVGAGFEPYYSHSSADAAFDPKLDLAISRMMEKQEPYPLLVMDRHYNLIAANEANMRLFAKILGKRAVAVLAQSPPNILRLTFDPEGLRPDILNWDSLARLLLLRLQREVLQNPLDSGLADLLAELLGYPDVPGDWHTPDFTLPSEATHSVKLKCGEDELEFLTTLTVFNAPQCMSLEEVQLESYFPLTETTERVCAELAAAGG